MTYISNQLQIEYIAISDFKDFSRQIRKFGKRQIEKTVKLIEACGFCVPLVVDSERRVIVGRGFLEAARRLNMSEVPAVKAEHLTEEQSRILRLAYDRIMQDEQWIKDELSAELQELNISFPDLDLSITGFDVGEIDLHLEIAGEEDHLPQVEPTPPVTQLGDLWLLGQHRLICADSRDEATYESLMTGDKARMTFSDPPYNVPVDGHVCGLGAAKHTEFAMASGEMSEAQFIHFLTVFMGNIRAYSVDGALHYVCMDWRHIFETTSAAKTAELALKNLCVWVKDNGGMGSFYRSQHELVFVFKQGSASHVNNIELGKHGRYRTNIWEYPGVNTFRKDRLDELGMHPTVKPATLVADAIKDASTRGEIVLDAFGGSGTTLIACEKTGRAARLIEIEPKYCDVAIQRWQKLTGQKAILASTGADFGTVALERGHDVDER